MPDTSGYYKLDGAALLYAPNAVYMPQGVTLTRAKPSTEAIQGWQWFASREAACTAYGYNDMAVAEGDTLDVQVKKLRAQVAAKDEEIRSLKAAPRKVDA